MATLYKLPSFVPFSYHKPFLNHKQLQEEREYPPKRNFAACACSIKKPRGSRKVKNNVELCNDLREFLSTVGLPDGHVPSFKELQDHGRNDLANIVRRRGYKLIRDLLSNSNESDNDEPPNTEKKLAEGPDAINHSADIIATDNICSLPSGSASGENKGFREPENMTEVLSKISSEENFENSVGESDTASSSNGSSSTSMQVVPSVTVSHPLRNESPAEGLASADVDQGLDVETSEKDNQVEINHLKLMLHQKELELSQLKEQIEKEKLALSVLQTKAEREISKAQKFISEKDAELVATEETLSGLVEIEIQYCGNGEMVEVAGSFNGWHHRIRLDPQPFSRIKDHFESRKSKLWSAMLWLYPGVYEIKFIVDGHWRVDPQMESVTKGGICNNILRVDR